MFVLEHWALSRLKQSALFGAWLVSSYLNFILTRSRLNP